jgi:hypothetical protein
MTLLPVLLPEGYAPKVSVNDKLTAGQIIAEKSERGAEEVIHVSQILGINPQKITKHIKKHLGDRISNGELLAEKKGKMGFGGKKIISEFSGTVIKIDEDAGDVFIHTALVKTSAAILSPVEGTVDFCNNDKIVIKTDRETLVAKEANGKDIRGELCLIDGEEVTFEKISGGVSKKIVLGKTFEKGSIFKAFGLGALGIVGIDIRKGDLEDLEEKGIESPVLEINEEDFKKLVKHTKDQIYLDPKNKAIVIL